MAPNDVAMIVEQVGRLEQVIIQLVGKVGGLEKQLEERQTLHHDCKKDTNEQFCAIYGEINVIKQQRAQTAGIKQCKQEAAQESDQDRNSRYKMLGLAFTAGGFVVNVIGYWPQIKTFFGW